MGGANNAVVAPTPNVSSFSRNELEAEARRRGLIK
jgi:hypothetical protein